MTFFKAGGYSVNLEHVIYSLYTPAKASTEAPIEGQAPLPNHSQSMVLTFVGGAKLELKGLEADKVKAILAEHS